MGVVLIALVVTSGHLALCLFVFVVICVGAVAISSTGPGIASLVGLMQPKQKAPGFQFIFIVLPSKFIK
jgi:hypothetical protein